MNSNSVLSIEESHEAGVCFVALAGRVDSTNANELTTRLGALISAGEKSIVVDLGTVLYLTSAAFRALLVATDRAEQNTARVSLCGLAGHIRELFEMSGMLELFTIHASRQEAIAPRL